MNAREAFDSISEAIKDPAYTVKDRPYFFAYVPRDDDVDNKFNLNQCEIKEDPELGSLVWVLEMEKLEYNRVCTVDKFLAYIEALNAWYEDQETECPRLYEWSTYIPSM